MAESGKRKLGGVLLEVSGLEHQSGGRTRLQKISLTVRAGEVVGLVGPNGAGKTTLVDCLCGIARPTSGEIHFAGHNLARRVAPATVRLVELAARFFGLISLLWLPLVLGVVWPRVSLPLETGAGLGLLALFRLGLVWPLSRRKPWSRLLAILFVAADMVCGAAWLWQSGRFAEVEFFGLFPFYPLLVPGALVLLMAAPVLLFLFLLPRVREAFGESLRPERVTALGLARTFQEKRLFPSLSLLDNVRAGRYCRTRAGFLASLLGLPGARAEERDTTEKAAACLRFAGLGKELEKAAGSLSYESRCRLEIARALATEPRLLLLDEPAAGLPPAEVERLARLLKQISQAGIAILLVEPDMKLVQNLADRVYVLDHGELVASGAPAEVRRDSRVIEAYLGIRGSKHAAVEA